MGNVGVVVVVKCEEPKEVLSLYREGVGKYRDTCRQGNGGSVLVSAKPKRIENQLFTSFSFSLAVIEYAIELSSTAHLLPADGSPPIR
ncbi:unnamed protein product [Brassica oleracea var. botrytis]